MGKTVQSRLCTKDGVKAGRLLVVANTTTYPPGMIVGISKCS